MSSIFGVDKKDTTNYKKMIKIMNKKGRDHSGKYIDDNISIYVKYLSTSDNPFLDVPQPYEYDNIVVFIDGKINNKYELIRMLEDRNVDIKTDSDQELVAILYKKHGKKFIRMIDGTYFITIYDKSSKKIILVRDVWGAKQGYYALKNNRFMFSNRLEYLVEYLKKHNHETISLEPKALDLYLSLGFVPSPYSIIENIYKVMPGEVILYDIKTKRVKRTNTLKEYFNEPYNVKDIVQIIDENISRSVKNYVEEGDEGILFSGDIESTSILSKMVALMPYESINAFNILMEDDKDIGKKIKEIAKKYNIHLHQEYLKYKDFKKISRELKDVLDEPYSDIDVLFYTHLSKKISKYTDSILTGIGGKEILGNKAIHKNYLIYKYLSKIGILKNTILFISKVLNPRPFSSLWYLKEIASVKTEDRFLLEYFKDHKYVSKYQKKWYYNIKKEVPKTKTKNNKIIPLYYYTYVADNKIAYIDKIMMYRGIEPKHPFLVRNIFIASLYTKLNEKTNIFNKNKILDKYAKKKLPKESRVLDEYDFKYNFEYNKIVKSISRETKEFIKELYKRGHISPDAYTFYTGKVFKRKTCFWESYVMRAYILKIIIEKYMQHVSDKHRTKQVS